MPALLLIDNHQHFLADVLDKLMSRCDGRPVGVATAHSAIIGNPPVRECLARML